MLGSVLLLVPMWIAIILFTITIHEYSHGLAANVLGDDTAKNAGRLTINPIPHLDKVGTIMLYFLHVGWAKPVPINPENFKSPKRDTAIVALAGPLSNLAVASLLAVAYHYLPFPHKTTSLPNSSHNLLIWLMVMMFQNAITINVGLALFNLLPVPPLDGSKIIGSFLPDEAYETFITSGEKWGSLLFVGLVAASFFGVNIISDIIGKPIEFVVRWLVY